VAGDRLLSYARRRQEFTAGNHPRRERLMKTAILTALASFAFIAGAAADEMQGTVKSVDMAKHMITLDDGMSVMTNKDVRLDNFMKGDHVKIMTDAKKMGTMVEKMK
jgi:hypothetical protein